MFWQNDSDVGEQSSKALHYGKYYTLIKVGGDELP